MKKSYNRSGSGDLKKAVLTGTAVGYATTVILLLLIAAVMYKADVSEKAYPAAATVLLSLSTLSGGITAGLISRSRVLIAGALTGTLFFLPIALVSVIAARSGQLGFILVKLLLAVLTASAGSVLTAIKKETKVSI